MAWWQLRRIQEPSVRVEGHAASQGEEFLAELQKKGLAPNTITSSATPPSVAALKQPRRCERQRSCGIGRPGARRPESDFVHLPERGSVQAECASGQKGLQPSFEVQQQGHSPCDTSPT